MAAIARKIQPTETQKINTLKAARNPRCSQTCMILLTATTKNTRSSNTANYIFNHLASAAGRGDAGAETKRPLTLASGPNM